LPFFHIFHIISHFACATGSDVTSPALFSYYSSSTKCIIAHPSKGTPSGSRDLRSLPVAMSVMRNGTTTIVRKKHGKMTSEPTSGHVTSGSGHVTSGNIFLHLLLVFSTRWRYKTFHFPRTFFPNFFKPQRLKYNKDDGWISSFLYDFNYEHTCSFCQCTADEICHWIRQIIYLK
jgi:hypothetical protein